MSIHLDLARGAAALMVLTGHAGQIGLLGDAWPLNDLFQHSAVVVFFVLSGLLIQQSASHPDMTLPRFVRARVARILPAAVFSIIFSTAILILMTWAGLTVLESGGRYGVSVSTIIMPLLFLSERLNGVGPPLNPPFWSLCYEVWFYLIFGLCVFTQGRVRVLLVASASMFADAHILLLMPTWLVGVATALYWERIRFTHPGSMFVLALLGFAVSQWSGLPHDVVWVASQLGINLTELRFSTFFITDFPGAVCVGWALVALRQLAIDPTRLKPVARRFAGMSFTLYLTHWPLLVLLKSCVGGMPASVEIVGAFIIPVAFALLLAPLLEVLLPRMLRRQDEPELRPPRTSGATV
ncbi:acyltransferase family protein [Sphingomonas mucosissima]|uniref:Acyltransferase family protein n=2 Tax=Sphingomonas mucosissima TaxID=370959 RepID=A0A245ZJN6_9SPHN|nr:acyltransferase family protein [Sphingomonas mucosissima]